MKVFNLKKILTFTLAFFFVLNFSVFADENKISYEQALNKVIENTDALENLEDSMVYLDEVKSNANTNLSDLNASMGMPLQQASTAYTQIIQLTRAIMSYENQISNYEMNKQILRDTAEFTLRNHIANIKSYMMDIDLLKKQIELGTKNLNVIKLKNERGLASDLELSNAQNNLAQQKNNLSNSNIKLQNEKQALNKLMGLDINSNIEVELEMPLETFDKDIDSYVLNEKNNSPVILMQRKLVSEAQYAVDSFTNLINEVESEPVNNLKKTTREYEQTIKTLENNIRSAYNNLKNLQENQNALEQNLASMQNIYNTNSIKYKAGLISANMLEESKINVEQAQYMLDKNEISCSNLIFSLNRSYLLMN